MSASTEHIQAVEPRQEPTAAPHTPWSHTLRTALLAAVAVCTVLLAFAWPSVTAKVQNLPVAAVGSTDQISQITTNAPAGALVEFSWAKVGTSIEVYDSRSGRMIGQYTMGADGRIKVWRA